MKRVVAVFFFAISLFLLLQGTASATLVLDTTKTECFFDFNSVAGGLPGSSTVPTGMYFRNVTNLASNPYGVNATFVPNHTSWTDTTAYNFRNSASPSGGGQDSASNSNRLIAARVSSPSFHFQFQDTIGLSGFRLRFDLWTLVNNSATTTFTVRWAAGPSATPTFHTIGSPFAHNGGLVQFDAEIGAAFANSSQIMNIQILATSVSPTGATALTRDVFGLDNFRLSYTPPAAVPEPTSILCVGFGVLGILIRRPSRLRG
ncbi:MAG: PEP-CTERM sorting domain-containing protein [Planctomycetaceae bacterium]|nr:PEP-CTERM sorting domain-containing protein [Planctomycetaceae bacterium]